MLSYQHAFHAGHAADIFKHAVLAEIIHHLTQKPAAITYYETHAGRGLYPLDAPETQKTAPHLTGLIPLLNATSIPPELTRFTTTIRQFYTLPTPSYPGSPAVAHACFRNTDTLHLAEAHGGEISHLKRWAKPFRTIHIHQADGHIAIPPLLPPPSKRALVLIDPAYELKDEYQTVITTVKNILARWKNTTIIIWYPVLPAARHEAMLAGLAALNIGATFHTQLIWNGLEAMAGSGQLILNTPYGSDASLTALTHALNTTLFTNQAQPITHYINPPR